MVAGGMAGIRYSRYTATPHPRGDVVTRNRSAKAGAPGRRPTRGLSALHSRMIAGDVEALGIYHRYQDDLVGPDPLAEGAHEWPAWSDLPSTLSPVRPLRGWRMWRVLDTIDGPRLVAPFITAVHHATPDTPGVMWVPGINRNARDDFLDKWGRAYPAIRTLWMNAWTEFVPFLDYDLEIRQVLCSTNAIESLNARFRRAVRARGHFPTEQAALKTLYLVV